MRGGLIIEEGLTPLLNTLKRGRGMGLPDKKLKGGGLINNFSIVP